MNHGPASSAPDLSNATSPFSRALGAHGEIVVDDDGLRVEQKKARARPRGGSSSNSSTIPTRIWRKPDRRADTTRGPQCVVGDGRGELWAGIVK